MRKLLLLLFAFCALAAGCSDSSTEQYASHIYMENLPGDRLYIFPGETFQIECRTEPAGAKIYFTSGDESIFTVSETGVVTGKDLGIATLTAWASDGFGRVAATTTVEVVKKATVQITAKTKEANILMNIPMDVSELFDIVSDVSDPDIRYVPSARQVVYKDGFITASATGTYEIYAATPKKDVSSEVVTLISIRPVTSITARSTTLTLNPSPGTPLNTLFTVSPTNATIQDLEYFVEDESVAKVEDGRIVYAANGSTILKARATDGSGVESGSIAVTCESGETPAKEWSATASSYYPDPIDDHPIPLPQYAVDNDPYSMWASDYDFAPYGDVWLLIDMKSITSFKKVLMSGDGNTIGYDIYLSDSDVDGLSADDPSLTKAGSFQNAVGSDKDITVADLGTTVQARYLKIHFTKSYHEELGVGLRVFTVYEIDVSE